MNEIQKIMTLIELNDWDAIKNSNIKFVRSQDNIAVFNDSASGRILTAYEVAQCYPEKLQSLLEDGVASLPCERREPAETIKFSRESRGISKQELADASGLPLAIIEDAENPETLTNINDLVKISTFLGVDDLDFSVKKVNKNYRLGCTLKTFSEDRTIKKKDVIAFSEASWVAKTQMRLEKWLNIKATHSVDQFQKCDFYGNAACPAWKVGYDLAQKTRKILELGTDGVFLREICENLHIPVVQSELSENIAGATICGDGIMAIVVANDSRHNDVLVRRMTIAHELGHLLWDTSDKLNNIRIDMFESLSENPEKNNVGDDTKYVEQRANSFAVQLLAPISESTLIEGEDTKEKITWCIEKYGISIKSAMYHLQNKAGIVSDRINIDSETLDRGSWEGKESYGIDLFPIRCVPISRRGLFSYRVAQCLKSNIIMEKTAAEYLRCEVRDIHNNIDDILNMFE